MYWLDFLRACFILAKAEKCGGGIHYTVDNFKINVFAAVCFLDTEGKTSGSVNQDKIYFVLIKCFVFINQTNGCILVRSTDNILI